MNLTTPPLTERDKRKKVPSPKEYGEGRIYDYSTPEGRVATAEWLFEQARLERTSKEEEWVKHDRYYNFAHDAADEMSEAIEEQGLSHIPACVPDPYIMVESQIIPDIPMPEFHGRDDDRDSVKAKQRELAVKYIIEANRLEDMNTSNERRLRKLGDAFWKAYYDASMPFGEKLGNIRIKDIPCENIYPDPTAGADGLQSGEYVDYVYTVHKLKFWRLYFADLKRLGVTLDDVLENEYRANDELLDPYTHPTAVRDDMIQVLEHWYRVPYDTSDAPAGAIACSIQAGGYEIRHIPNYWKNTCRQNQRFPFEHYWCIRDETGFWNRSEIAPIISLVDSADRELATGLLNDAFTANDIVVVEEGALKPGTTVSNVPGEVIEVMQGRINGVRRLGGLGSGVRSLNMVEWLQSQIQRTNRNYDTNNGQETSRVTTASGLLQLRSDAEGQKRIKKADRDAGFCRLYELLDWLALEFFDEDHLIFVGAKSEHEEPQELIYNSNNFSRTIPATYDMVSGDLIAQESKYFPRIDVRITTGDGLSQNPATTVEVLDKLAGINVTADNWQLLAAELEYLDIPQKQVIIDSWRRKFEPEANSVPPEVIAALENDPELLAAVKAAVTTSFASPAMPAGALGGRSPVPLDVAAPITAPVPQDITNTSPVAI